MPAIVDNRKIAKNTLYLYLRMIVSLCVSLYTSRVILQVLGIDDLGIYNVVGGIIVLFSYISNSLRSCTQRFLSYQLGKNDREEANRVMNISLLCHFIFAVIGVFLLLTVGLWFVIEKLNIPESRESAAIIVYLISIITFVVGLFQAPYQAAILSHEKMSFFAIISIVEVVLKLVIVYALLLIGGDKLIVYSILMLTVTFILLLSTCYYCYHKLNYPRPKIVKDKILFRQFFSYSGWSMFNSGAYMGMQQGENILVNIFYGVAANGALGIANQVANALYGFVSNFQVAFNPQIVKAYAAGEKKELFQLINRASYFGYYIFLIIAIPILFKIEYLLSLWLGTVPEYLPGFCRLLLLYFIVDSIEAPLWMLIGATGKMKVYSIWMSIFLLLNLPIAWVMLRFGWSVYWVFIVRVLINIIISIIRPFYLKQLVQDFSLRDYLKNALTRPLILTIIIQLLLVVLSNPLNAIHPLLAFIVVAFITLVLIYLIGLKRADKMMLVNLINEKIRNNRVLMRNQ